MVLFLLLGFHRPQGLMQFYDKLASCPGEDKIDALHQVSSDVSACVARITQQETHNLFWPDENSIEQCFAAHIVQGCQQYCSTLLHLIAG